MWNIYDIYKNSVLPLGPALENYKIMYVKIYS